MTIAERSDFGPTSHQQQAVQDLDKLWRNAQERAKSAAWDTFGAAHYPFHDPTGAAKAIGQFGIDAVKKGIDEIRETWGAGATWWNEITDITHTPCEESWTVIVTLALPAAADALYLLTTPSPEEVLENYLQPYPSKTHRRGSKDERAKKRKKSRSGKVRRSWGVVPDVDNWAAAIIPGAEMVKGRKAGAPTRWVFDGIDRLDRVLWWFLILEATEQFFSSWSSGMREARFCSQPWDHIANGSLTVDPVGGQYIFPNGYDYSVFNVKGVTGGDAIWRFVTPSGADVNASGEFTFSFTFENKQPPATANPQLWLQVKFSGLGTSQPSINGPTVSPKTPGPFTIAVTGPIQSQYLMTIELLGSGGLSGWQPGWREHNVSIFAKSD